MGLWTTKSMRGGCMTNNLKSRWSCRDQARFLQELGDLLENGFTLYEGIEFSLIHGKKKYQEEIKDALEILKDGHSFRDFLECLNFDQELVGLVSYGEKHGQLSKSLQNGGTIWRKKSEDRAKLKNLLYYPVFLLVFTFALLQVFTNYLLPKFSSMYQGVGQESNIFLKLSVLLATLINNLPLIIILLLTMHLVIYHYYLKKLSKIKQELLINKVPFFRSFRRLSTTYYFSMQLGSLLKGGISIVDALTIMSQQDPKSLVKEITHQMIKSLQEGDSLESICGDLRIFMNDFERVISHGQKNSLLGEELLYYSKFLLNEMELQTEKYIKVVQPLMFGLVAILVIFLYLAILMPMISLMNTI